MILSDLMKRRRFQRGSLLLRKRGRRKVWALQYYDASGSHRYHTIGPGNMSKTDAEAARAAFMRTINGGDELEANAIRPVLLREFVEQVYFPFQRGKWKESTAGTTEQRIRTHVLGEFQRKKVMPNAARTIPTEADDARAHRAQQERGIDTGQGAGSTVPSPGTQQIQALTLTGLQAFLDQKAAAGLSFSVVDHLRWDLKSILEMAVHEKVIPVSPAAKLYTPKAAKVGAARSMTEREVSLALAVMPEREVVILRLAIFAGLRPGELLSIQRRHVGEGGLGIRIEQRVYRGVINDPKSEASTREAAIPPGTAALLSRWLEFAVGPNPDAYVFAGRTGKPIWRDSLLEDHIRPRLEPLGLGWVDFQVMRRTHASLGHGIDPKAMADQRGHGIGVAVDVYTKSSIEDRAEAGRKLEEKVM